MGQILFAPAGAGVTSDDVTATKAQVLSGYTALTKDSNDDPISGTMTNRGAWTSSSSGSGKITIPAGYHNGSGYVDCSGAYNKGVTDADNRTNTNSANYKAGYNAGISAADARVNTSSASYNNGYNAGYTNGHNQGVTDKRNDLTGNKQYVSLSNPADSGQCQWDVQGKAGYSGVIFQLTGASFWVWRGDDGGNSSSFPVSYNSSTGVVHIGPFYRHTSVQGYIYYY